MLQKFIKYIRYEKGYSSHTVLSYNNDISQFEEYLLQQTGEVNHAAVDSDIVRNYVVWLMGQNMTPRSVGRKLSALRTFYKYLVKLDVVALSPVAMVAKPKEAKPLPSFVKQSDMAQLLEEGIEVSDDFVSLRDRLILDVLYQTGMRRAELLQLRDKDVDMSARTIKVTGKRNKQRIIPYGAKLQSSIEKYIAVRNKEVGGEVETLFVRENGEPLYPMMVYRIVKAGLAKVSTLSKLSPHVLRHTFASAMLNNGAEMDSVKELLGHASLTSTQVYTHITFEELKHNYNHAHPRALKKGGLYGD
ncbi:MAG: tyrosine-type recombinase/integrase [Bacteroidaceae bacterium]|nr:tyrosine-type recombinase/integrase [Bacteroidaceae bacterium]